MKNEHGSFVFLFVNTMEGLDVSAFAHGMGAVYFLEKSMIIFHLHRISNIQYSTVKVGGGGLITEVNTFTQQKFYICNGGPQMRKHLGI